MKRCSRFELREVQTTTEYCLRVPIMYRMAQIRNTAAPNVWSNRNTHSLLVGIRMVQPLSRRV